MQSTQQSDIFENKDQAFKEKAEKYSLASIVAAMSKQTVKNREC